jgi:hypothetical protein
MRRVDVGERMPFEVLDADGKPLDALYDLEGPDIIFHSRGGAKADVGASNRQYGLGLRLILQRIAASPLRIDAAWVDSSRVQALPMEERLVLTAADMEKGAAAAFTTISRRMKKVGASGAGSTGGNSTKRLRIRLSPGPTLDQIHAVINSRRHARKHQKPRSTTD